MDNSFSLQKKYKTKMQTPMDDASTRTNFPRYLLIKMNTGSFSTLSPFLINNVITKLVGTVKCVRKIRDGLIVQVLSAKQSAQLLALKLFDKHEVQVETYDALNTSKGVIYSPDLLNCTIEEMASELKAQGVIEVRRITSMRNKVVENTPSCILTFDSPELPATIIAGYLQLPVRMYIPNPMRCFRCQRFGHTASRCKNDEICVCGQSLHRGTECTETPCCVNCNGQHRASSKQCPMYIMESKIQRIKVTERISYSEAKRKVHPEYDQAPRPSYATVTSSTNKLTTPSLHELAVALIPELLQLLRQHNNLEKKPEPKTTASNFQNCAPNVTPTSVLQRNIKARNDSTQLLCGQNEQEQNTDGILNWFKSTHSRATTKTLKRSKTKSSATASPMTSATDDPIVPDQSSSGSNEKPAKKKQLRPETDIKETSEHGKHRRQHRKTGTYTDSSDYEVDEQIFDNFKKKHKDTESVQQSKN